MWCISCIAELASTFFFIVCCNFTIGNNDAIKQFQGIQGIFLWLKFQHCIYCCVKYRSCLSNLDPIQSSVIKNKLILHWIHRDFNLLVEIGWLISSGEIRPVSMWFFSPSRPWRTVAVNWLKVGTKSSLKCVTMSPQKDSTEMHAMLILTHWRLKKLENNIK